MRIARSARKHGITEEEMLHAIRNHSWVYEDDGVQIYVGASNRGGAMLEVGVLMTDSEDIIIHAMKARPKYLP